MKTIKPPLKTIGRLLARHLRESDRGSARYKSAGDALERALALGAPIGQPIPLPGEREAVVNDHCAESNRIFVKTFAKRYSVELCNPEKGERESEGPWTDVREELPHDEEAVHVRAGKQKGTASYDSVADEWFVYAPGAAMHGRRWSEVRGPLAVITHWQR